MQDIFAHAELRVARHRRRIRTIGLHEYDVCPPIGRDPPEFQDQSHRDALPAVGGGNREVVDVDLAALLLELVQLVLGREAAHHLTDLHGDERNEGIASEQALQIGRAGPRPSVGLRLGERSPNIVDMASSSATSDGASR